MWSVPDTLALPRPGTRGFGFGSMDNLSLEARGRGENRSDLPCFPAMAGRQEISDSVEVLVAVEELERNRMPTDANDKVGSVSMLKGLGLAAAVVTAASLGAHEATATESPCTVGQRVNGMCFATGLHSNLPVVSDGKRFTSQPYGESRAILQIARTVKRYGTLSHQRMPALRISGRTPLQSTNRYDFRFPESCGGYRFSYLEGKDLRALGLHRQGRLVVDVLEGGGAFSGPRLWGVNDQVLNGAVPMKLVAADDDEGGLGLYRHMYAVGYVTMLPDAQKQSYGDAYAAATREARQCRDVVDSELARAQ